MGQGGAAGWELWRDESQEPEAQVIARPARCSSQSCGLCPPLRGDEVAGVGEGRQARTGIKILLREAPGLKVGGWNRMLPLPQPQES